MSCYCGDYCCPSCGPAQGNWRCPICRTWVSEGCEHITDTDPPALKPEFEAEADRRAETENQADEWLERLLQEHPDGNLHHD